MLLISILALSRLGSAEDIFDSTGRFPFERDGDLVTTASTLFVGYPLDWTQPFRVVPTFQNETTEVPSVAHTVKTISTAATLPDISIATSAVATLDSRIATPKADTDSTKTKTRPVVWDTPIAIPERPTLVYDTPIAIPERPTLVYDTPVAISETYTAAPSDSDTTKTKTRPVIWDTPIAIPERPTLVYDTPIAISETYTAEPSDSDTTKRPTFVWDTPITIPETATPVWDTPITIPETATPVWDTPMTIPERPTPVWDTPITIPETPTPVWDTPITISETYTASTGHQTSTGGANVSVTSMAAQITRIGETTTISSQCVKPLTALDGEQLLVLDADGVMSCMTYCHERRNCTHFEFNIESLACRLLRDPHTAWHDSTVISGRGCTAPAVYRTVAAIVGAAAVLGGVAGGAMWIFKSRREPTQSFRVTKAPTYKVQNSLLPGSTPVAPAEYSTEFAAGSAPGTGNARVFFGLTFEALFVEMGLDPTSWTSWKRYGVQKAVDDAVERMVTLPGRRTERVMNVHEALTTLEGDALKNRLIELEVLVEERKLVSRLVTYISKRTLGRTQHTDHDLHEDISQDFKDSPSRGKQQREELKSCMKGGK